MPNIVVLDPSIDSSNMGDRIIRESVLSVLRRIPVPESRVQWLPTQRSLTRDEAVIAKRADVLIVGGTNLLSSNMPFYRQWKVGPRELRAFRGKVVLLGVGWWQYQKPPNRYTRVLLRHVLSTRAIHSVRDGWTKTQLEGVSVRSVNTSCPTLWDLPTLPERTPVRGDSVLITLTDYNRNPLTDQKLLTFATQNYSRIRIWPQGAKDARYVRGLQHSGVILDPGLESLDFALQEPGTDYIGTRLHAGIRALQHGVRSTILMIDNRAREIARDTGIPVASRELREEDMQFLMEERKVELRLPIGAIETWLSTFRSQVLTRY